MNPNYGPNPYITNNGQNFSQMQQYPPQYGGTYGKGENPTPAYSQQNQMAVPPGMQSFDQYGNMYNKEPRKQRGTFGKVAKAGGRVIDSLAGVIIGTVGGALLGAGTFGAQGIATGLTGLASNPMTMQMGHEGRSYGALNMELFPQHVNPNQFQQQGMNSQTNNYIQPTNINPTEV